MTDDSSKAGDTIPAPPPETPIRAGHAQQNVAGALVNLLAAVATVERLAMACARALDSQATEGSKP